MILFSLWTLESICRRRDLFHNSCSYRYRTVFSCSGLSRLRMPLLSWWLLQQQPESIFSHSVGSILLETVTPPLLIELLMLFGLYQLLTLLDGSLQFLVMLLLLLCTLNIHVGRVIQLLPVERLERHIKHLIIDGLLEVWHVLNESATWIGHQVIHRTQVHVVGSTLIGGQSGLFGPYSWQSIVPQTLRVAGLFQCAGIAGFECPCLSKLRCLEKAIQVISIPCGACCLAWAILDQLTRPIIIVALSYSGMLIWLKCEPLGLLSWF